MKRSSWFIVHGSWSKTILLVTSCLLIVIGLCGCQNQRLYRESRAMMGTFVEVISPDKRAIDIVFAEIKRIEDLLSKYKEDSEVAKLNKLGKLKVSPETFYVIKKAKEFWRVSDGAFDISVGPLADLWGFTEKKYRLPSEQEIKKTLALVGSDKIILQEDEFVIKFGILSMKIDLGAIAKGYAVDCAIKKLKEKGIISCLINAGGDIYCLGDKFGQPWNVAIQNPRGKGLLGYIELKDRGIATSGDYEKYFITHNKRYAHILNPKTGHPENSGVISVTVMAPNCLTADALATAIFVLGKKKGEVLAKNFTEIEVQIIEEKNVENN